MLKTITEPVTVNDDENCTSKLCSKNLFSLEPNQEIKTEHLVTYHTKNGILMRAERREA